MIKFVNKELFQLNTERERGEHGDYYKTTVSSSIEVTNQKTGKKMHRIITTILSDMEDYNDSSINVGIRSTTTKNGSARVSLNVSGNNKYDTDVYLVAIPFNGFIDEIEKSFQYRIYRGVMVKSEKRDIVFNGEKYKKIAYMIVVPNLSMLKEEHKYHVDTLSLTVSSYNLETVDDNQETVKYTTTVEFKDRYTVDVTSTTENVDPVSPDDFKGKTIFPIYIKEHNAKNDSNRSKKFNKR